MGKAGRTLENACTTTRKDRGKGANAALSEVIARAARDGGVTHHQMGSLVNLFFKNFVDVLCEKKILAIQDIGTFYAAPHKAHGTGKGRVFSKVSFVTGRPLRNEVDTRVPPTPSVLVALRKHRKTRTNSSSRYSTASRQIAKARLQIIRSANGEFQSVFVQPTGKVS